MPRPTKLTPELRHKIVERLKSGATVEATCDSVGIHKQTFYNWRNKGEAAKSGAYFDFFDAVTRAQADGLVAAAECFYNGMQPSQTKSVMTETIEETRLRKVKDADGKMVEEPYTYKRTITRKTTTHIPGDWRAAMEYLARRDPANWARPAPQKTEVSRDGDKIIIKTGMSMDDI